MSNKYTSVYDWLKYIKANVVGINLRELRIMCDAHITGTVIGAGHCHGDGANDGRDTGVHIFCAASQTFF